jgi:hypothetical protein
MHISVNKAVSQFGKNAENSMTEKFTQLYYKGYFSRVDVRALSYKQRKAIIRSHMFLKEKYLSTGEFEKIKARLVAGSRYLH